MTAQLVVLGVKEVDDMLAELEPKLANQALRPAIRGSVKTIVLPLVRSRMNFKTGSGLLKRDLVVRAAKGLHGKRLPRGIFGSAVTFRSAGSDGNVFTGKTFYGGILEYGTKKHARKPRHRIKAMKFLRSSLYDSEKRVRSYVADRVMRFIPKVKAKRAQKALFGKASLVPKAERIRFR